MPATNPAANSASVPGSGTAFTPLEAAMAPPPATGAEATMGSKSNAPPAPMIKLPYGSAVGLRHDQRAALDLGTAVVAIGGAKDHAPRAGDHEATAANEARFEVERAAAAAQVISASRRRQAATVGRSAEAPRLRVA